tara:strand:+ start:3868 stop:19329 length:15462 start_codon:yes stop_codon:yes gene_type:complete
MGLQDFIQTQTQGIDPITQLPERNSEKKISGPKKASAAADPLSLQDYIHGVDLGFQDPSMHQGVTYNTNFYDWPDVDFGVSDPSQIDMMRASRQTGWDQFTSFLNQFVIGEIVGGTIEGFGSLLDLINLDINDGFTNAISDLGGGIREWTKEVTPIYEMYPGSSWQPNDSGWWYNNMVSIGSALSLFFPAWAVTKAGKFAGVGPLKAVNNAARASKYSRIANTGKFLDRKLFSNKTTDWMTKAVVGGVSMRYMENYREAAETGLLSYEKNLAWFQNQKNLDEFLESEGGQQFLKESGISLNDPALADAAARYISSHAAAHTFKWDWTNAFFDIAQYGLMFGRAKYRGKGATSSAVRTAQDATLKAPKTVIPKTRLGKVGKWIKPKAKALAKFGLWSYTEAIEEQINWIAMQEGILQGDLLAGFDDVGRDTMTDDSLLSRLRKYSTQGGFWSSSIMGFAGGAVMTAGAGLMNRKAYKKQEQAKIQAITKRMEMLANVSEQMKEAQEKGDTYKVKQLQRLLAVNLAMNNELVNNGDLLKEMMEDPIMEEILTDAGITQEQIKDVKADMLSIIEQASTAYNKYFKSPFGAKYGPGISARVAQQQMAVQIYQNLINEINEQVELDLESDIYSQEKYKQLGAQTKMRHNLIMQIKASKLALEQLIENKEGLEQYNNLKDTPQSEREKNDKLINSMQEQIKELEGYISELEVVSDKLKSESSEILTPEQFQEEEKFLEEVENGDVLRKRHRQAQYRALRDMALKQIQNINKLESGKELTTMEKKDLDEVLKPSIEQAAAESATDALIQDFRDFIVKEKVTEEDIDQWMLQHPDNARFQEAATKIKNEWLQIQQSLKNKEALQQALKEAKEKQDEIDRIEKLNMEMNKEQKDILNKEKDQLNQQKQKNKMRKAAENAESSKTDETKTTPTTTSNPTVLDEKTLKETKGTAMTPQFMSYGLESVGPHNEAVVVTVVDSNGNPVPKSTLKMIPMTEAMNKLLTENRKEFDRKYQVLYYYPPRLNSSGYIVREGKRIVLQDNAGPKILTDKKGNALVIRKDSNVRNNNEIFDFQAINDPNIGVGTDIILRPEPNNEFYKSNDPTKMVISIRLASDPTVNLGQLRISAFSKENTRIREIFAKQKELKDIKGKIAGKGNGWVLRLKKDGKSIEQPISVLGDANSLILGYGNKNEGVIIWQKNNMDFDISTFIEHGAIYAAIKRANGILTPVRLSTSNLSQEAADAVIEIILDYSLTPATIESEIKKIVNTVRTYSKNAPGLVFDNFEIVFPYKDKIIGLQYRAAGQNKRNNFLTALNGHNLSYNPEFFFVEYDKETGAVKKQGKNKYISSKTLDLSGKSIREALVEHLMSKKYNIQKARMEMMKDPFQSKLGSWNSYFEYLTDPNILPISTDIPANGSQQFYNSNIYVEPTEEKFKSNPKKVPDFLNKGPEFNQNSNLFGFDPQAQIDNKYSPSFDPSKMQNLDNFAREQMEKKNKKKEIIKKAPKKKPPTKSRDDIDTDFKLRQYEVNPESNLLLSEEEVQWFIDKFGEEGLEIAARVKYITLKDGRQAYGYYHQGMVTLAQFAKKGTAYWEAMRRIIDLHLTANEKSSLFKAAQQQWGIQNQQELETKLAESFMEYRITQENRGLIGTIAKFFKDIMTYIKKFLGMDLTLNEMFSDLSSRNYNKYTTKELRERSTVAYKLRQKPGYTNIQKNEIVDVITNKMREAYQKEYGDLWLEKLTDPKILVAKLEAARQNMERIGEQMTEAGIEQGEEWSKAALQENFYSQFDENNINVVSPGFRDLVVRNLTVFGVRFGFKESGKLIETQNAEIEEQIDISEENTSDIAASEEFETDLENAELETAQHIHGINFFERPRKATLSKDVKIELSLIQKNDGSRGGLLGEKSFYSFSEVYSYLKFALANTPQGDVMNRLELLAEDNKIAEVVLDRINNGSPAFKNKFITHMNDQLIDFEIPIIQDGMIKLVYANRNSFNRMIINDWIGNREVTTDLFNIQEGKQDTINESTAKEIFDLWSNLKFIVKEGDQQKEMNAHREVKKKYIEQMKKILDRTGILIPNEAYNSLYNNDEVFVRDLHKYMSGSNSYSHILAKLRKGISPFVAGDMEMGSLNKFAQLASNFKVDKALASFHSNGKNIYAINLNTFDSKRVLELRSKNTYESAINKYKQDTFYEDHLILDLIEKFDNVREKLSIVTLDSLKEAGYKGRSTSYKDLNPQQSLLTRWAFFTDRSQPFTKINIGTRSDKMQSMYMALPRIYPGSSHITWNGTSVNQANQFVDTAVDLLYPLALREYGRILKVQDQLFGDNKISRESMIQNYHYKNEPGDHMSDRKNANGLRFIIFPTLNNIDFYTELGMLRDSNTASQEQMSNAVKEIKNKLREYVIQNITETLNKFEKEGIVSKNEKDNTYKNILLPPKSLQGKTINTNIMPALVEFAINDIVYLPHIYTMMMGDPAFYKADNTGNIFIDAGKRNYAGITPGFDPVIGKYGMSNTISHSIFKDVYKKDPTLVENIRKALKEAGSKKADQIADQFANLNKTDAQSFSTIEFYKSYLESQGKWIPEKHGVYYEKYWSKGKLGNKESKKLLFDPLKTFYWGDRIVEDNNGRKTLVWEQIKHSVYPLLREMTENEKDSSESVTINNLRQRMEAVGKYSGLKKIDMVSFESAVKTGAVGISNPTTQEQLKDIVVTELDTRNLRSPQVVDFKAKKQLYGTQFGKLITANIESNFNYTLNGISIKGDQIRDLYDSAFAEKIKRSHDGLVKEMGWQEFKERYENRDEIKGAAEFNQYYEDQKKFLLKVRGILENSLNERELEDNYYLILNIDEIIDNIETRYDFQAPLSFPTFAKTFESILNNLYKNRVLRQKTKGMGAIQIAQYGHKLSDELTIKPTKNGGFVAQIKLPYQLGAKYNLPAGVVTEEYLAKNNITREALTSIGYRIPTQLKVSMMALEIVEVLPENAGGIVILPTEVVNKMGADFDIDKMFLMFPELTNNGEKISAFDYVKYKEKQNFDGVSTKALDNLIYDINYTILTSKNHVEEVMNPLDTDVYVNLINKYERLGIIPTMSRLNLFSTSGQMYLEEVNKQAAALIGAFSNHSVGSALSQSTDMTIKPEYSINIRANNISSHVDLTKIKGFDGEYILNYIAAHQSESLDNAKNLRIGRAGVTLFNHGVIAILNRAGFNVETALDFINQPIIRKLEQNVKNAPAFTNHAQIARTTAEQLGQLDYYNNINRKNLIEFTPTASYLNDTGLQADLSNEADLKKQIQILSDFMRYLKVAKDVSKSNRYLSPDGIKRFSRLSYLEQFMDNVDYIQSSKSAIEITKIPKRVQSYITYGIESANEFTSFFIPFNKNGFIELKRNIAQLTGQEDGILSPQNIDTINSLGLYFSVIKPDSPMRGLFYTKSGEVRTKSLENVLFKYQKSLASRLAKIKKKHDLFNDPFLGLLYAHPDNLSSDKFIQLIAFNNSVKLDPSERSEITDRWAELLLDPREDVANLAKSLISYSIVTSGLMKGPNSFVDLVPVSYWKSSGLTNYFRTEANSMWNDQYFLNATHQIIRNMFTDPGFLKIADKKVLHRTPQLIKAHNLKANQHYLHKSQNPNLIIEGAVPNSNEFVHYFRSYNAGKWRLYKFLAASETNSGNLNGAIYQEIPPLGERYRFVEMYAQERYESIHPANKTEQNTQPQTNMFDSGSITSRNNTLEYRLSPEMKESALKDLDNYLIGFAEKHFGVKAVTINNLKKKLGVDAVGAADMLNRIMYLDQNRDRYTVPEELSHFFIEALEDKPTVQRLLALASKTDLYGQVVKDYEKLYTEDYQFQKETAGKILAEYIVNEQQVREKYKGFIGTLRKIWDQIKALFTRNQEAKDELRQQLDNVFGPMASRILNGDITGLNIDNLGVEKYYALNNQKQNFSQMINESNRIQDPTTENNFYELDGIKLNRTTSFIEAFSKPFASKEIAEKVAAANRRAGNPFNTSEKVEKLWEFLKDGVGTQLHKTMEGIVNNLTDKQIIDSLNLDTSSKAAINKNLPKLRAWVRSKITAGSRLYTETKVADKSDIIAGQVDIIEVTSTGKRIIHDFKTKMKGKFLTLESQLPSFTGPLATIPNNLLNQYRLQLSLYRYIIQNKGIKIDEMNIVGLEADVTINKAGEVIMTSVDLLNPASPVASKLKKLKPIKNKTLKNMFNFLNPNNERAQAEANKETDRISQIFETAKNNLKKKIASLQRQKDAKEYVTGLKDLLGKLDEIGEKEGLILFMRRANADIDAAYNKLRELETTSSVNIPELNKVLKFVQTYDMLDEISLAAPLLANEGYEQEINEIVAPAIYKRQKVYELYKALGRPLLANFLSDYISDPRIENKEEFIQNELVKAGRDISLLARWLDAMGDSKDSVLAAVDKLVKEQVYKTHEQEQKFLYGTGKEDIGLYERIKKLEAFQTSKGVGTNSFRELYDFMLEKTKDGKLTGRILNQHTYEWYEKKRKFVRDSIQNGTNLSSKDTWSNFFKNNPIEYSEQYKKLQALPEGDQRKIFYNYFIENFKYANTLLEQQYRRGTEETGFFLPSIRASKAELLLESDKKLKRTAKETLIDYFTVGDDQTSYGEIVSKTGEPLSYVPTHYTLKIGTGENFDLTPEEVSYDLGSSLRQFFTMANNYNNMQTIINELEMTKELLKHRQVRKLSGKGMPIVDKVTGEEITYSGEISRSYDRFNDYLDMIVYQKKKKKGSTIKTLGGGTRQITDTKLVDLAINYNALRVLALNPHVGLSNAGFGMLLNWVEAFAGQYLNLKTYGKSTAKYNLSLPGIINDVASRRPTSKLGMLLENFDVLSNFNEAGQRIDHKNFFIRSLNPGAIYFMMSAGEHRIQSQLFIAQMMNMQFKLSSGKYINLWDAYKVKDKRLVLNPEVAEQFTHRDKTDFIERVKAVYQRMHGIYNSSDRAALQQYAMGRAAMQFRKWLRPGAMRRFEGIEKVIYDAKSPYKKADYNERLMSEVEGNYVTAAKFIVTMFKEARQLNFEFGKRYKELPTWQKANLKRALGEIAFLMLLLILPGRIRGDKEDDELSRAEWQALYTIKRVESELLFYLPTTAFFDILRTPMAGMSGLEALYKFFSQGTSDLTSVLTGGDFERYKRKTRGYDKGDAKISKYFKRILPFKEWNTHPGDKIKFFDLK